MNHTSVWPTRRAVLAGFGGLALAGAAPFGGAASAAGTRKTLVIRAAAGSAALQPGGAELARPLLSIAEGASALRRGDEAAVRFENALTQPALLTWRGLDGAAAAEPLVTRKPVPPGGSDSFTLPLRSAGTLLLDLRLAADPAGAPMPALPLIVQEPDPPEIDGDRMILIEDFRLAPGGRLLAPGVAPGDATRLYTVNGKPTPEIALRANGRFRLRFVNACQRNVVAIRIEDHELRVMALDGQPAEPFLARNATLVLAPGGRADALLDAARPPGSRAAITLHDGSQPATIITRLVYSGEPALRAAALAPAAPFPGSQLPAQLPLASALRAELTLGGAAGAPTPEWAAPDAFVPAAKPAFQVKRGRTVVLTLNNRAALPVVFNLHGHHFRLLDRLDDGWKPFWLDTLAIDSGQTQRIAFAAEHPGLWLMQAMAADWSAPRLLRSYLVS